jgi:hypothetical protein
MVLSKQQYETLNAAGMIDPSKVIQEGFGKVQLNPGTMIGGLEHRGDLPGWMQEVLRPHLEALAKKNADPGLMDAFFDSYLAKVVPNRKAAQAAMMFSDPGFVDQRMKDLGLAGAGKSIPSGYGAFINNNPVGVEAAYEAQKKSMIQAIGTPLMQAAIPVMKAMTDIFQKIGAFANGNSATVTAIAGVVTAIAGLSAIGGTLAIVSAAFAGFAALPAASIAAGATALASFVYINWDEFKKIPGVVKDFVSNLASNLIDGIKSIPNMVSAVITEVFKSIGDMITKSIYGLSFPGKAPPGTKWHAVESRIAERREAFLAAAAPACSNYPSHGEHG